MLLQEAVKRRRLQHGKQSIAGLPGWAAWATGPPLEWQTPEDDHAQRYVFLVMISAVLPETQSSTEAPPRDVQELSRPAVLQALLDAVAHPVQDTAHCGGKPRTRTQVVEKAVLL